ncbi:MAG: MDR family oxidoreductase [Sphingomonadales bacterium]
MGQTVQAIIARDRGDGKVTGALETLPVDELPDLPVTVSVEYSTLNYKDALAVTGAAPICRKPPMVCGIDLAGTVSASSDQRFKAGDRVLVNGYGLSEVHWGGYAQQQRLNPDWLVRIPDAFSAKDTMAIGTAGYTAMLSVMALLDHGLKPEDGLIAISGASGGVGSVALLLLKTLGYSPAAITGRPEENKAHFTALGASEILPRSDFERDSKPLEKELFAGAIDSVGSKTLATLLAQPRIEGIVAACGLAAGAGLPSTVMPFILRGGTLRGIDSVMAGMERRQRAWDMLADLIDPKALEGLVRIEPLTAVPDLGRALLAGELTGRIVVDVNA